MNRFTLGERVTWKSQAAGSETTKTGEVVAIVPAGRYSADYIRIPAGEGWILSNLDGSGIPRNHESYLVLVRPPKGNGKPRLYWPRVSALTRGSEPLTIELSWTEV